MKTQSPIEYPDIIHELNQEWYRDIFFLKQMRQSQNSVVPAQKRNVKVSYTAWQWFSQQAIA